MKYLFYVVALLVVNYCSAASNRTTLWVVGEEHLYSSDKGYQACYYQTTTTNILTLSSNAIVISGTDSLKLIASPPAAAANAAPATATDIAVFTGITVAFTITDGGATVTKSFALVAFATAADMDTEMTKIHQSLDSYSILTPSGNSWLTVQRIGTFDELNVAATTGGVSYRSVLITDYKSNSSVSVIAWQDGDDDTGDDDPVYNHLYMVVVRTSTDLITSGVLKTGCTNTRTSKRRRDVRASALTTCSLSSYTYTDSSFQNSKTSICSLTKLGNAINVAASTTDTVRSVDTTLFGAASSKFTLAANFGVLIAMSSIIFSLLN